MLVINTIPAVYFSARDLLARRGTKFLVYWEVAKELGGMGVRPGDKIASISYANVNNVKWARLARVQIIAEVYHRSYDEEQERNDFWKADPSIQEQILQAFSSAGVHVVVSDEKPRGPGAAGWQLIGNTGYYVHFLAGSGAPLPGGGAAERQAPERGWRRGGRTGTGRAPMIIWGSLTRMHSW
jgi:hypothetical protein